MDREKVINGLRDIDMFIAGRLGHEKAKNFLRTIDETIALLKEQEAVEPIPYHRSDGTIFKYECRECRTKIFKMDLFCRHCGRSVKWE